MLTIEQWLETFDKSAIHLGAMAEKSDTAWHPQAVTDPIALHNVLRDRLKELAGQHRRHATVLHSCLRIDGWAINVKRTYGVYREEGLMAIIHHLLNVTKAQRLSGSAAYLRTDTSMTCNG